MIMHIQQSSVPYFHLAEKTHTPHHPSMNIHMVSTPPVQGYHLSDCRSTWDSPEVPFKPSKQRPDQFNLASINLKNMCCFMGKTYVLKIAGSLTFSIICGFLSVGEAEMLHISEARLTMLFHSGKWWFIQKKGLLLSSEGKANTEAISVETVNSLGWIVFKKI